MFHGGRIRPREITRFSSMDVAWYACTKTEAEGSVGDVARRIVSLLGLASLMRPRAFASFQAIFCARRAPVFRKACFLLGFLAVIFTRMSYATVVLSVKGQAISMAFFFFIAIML